jgi:N-acetylneuraminate synthase
MRAIPKVVAEIGCNHKGDLAIAREMIATAAQFCKANAVKFQKRHNRTLLTAEQFAAPHPNPAQAYGSTYGAHREALEFTLDQHRELKALCDEFGVEYSTSVWDRTSAREMMSLCPKQLKVPSAANLNWPLLDVLIAGFGGEIHLSLGMTTRREEDEIVDFFDRQGRLRDLVLYACTSDYPVAFEDICLREITRLCATYGGSVAAIGFSGHHLGIAADIAALALGAEWFERHFTLDRTWKGTDHAASLEPYGLRRLTRDLAAVALALKHKPATILDCERPQREKLKWSTARYA